MAVDIGARIRSLRRQREMDVTALARAAGLSRGYLSHVESGAAVPSIPALERLGEILGVPVSAFFGDGAAGFAPPDDRATVAAPTGAGAAPITGDANRHPQGLGPTTTVARGEIVRAGERRSVIWPTLPNHRYEVLVPDLNRAVEVMMIEVTPPDDTQRLLHSHYGEGFVLVLEGTFNVVLEEETHVLEPGDAIYFPNTLRHGVSLIGDRPGRAIWVQAPPYF